MKKLVVFLTLALMVSALLVPASAAGIDDGLLLHYKFDEESGTAVKNETGGNELTLNVDSRHVPGIMGGALSFDGTPDQVLQVTLADNPELKLINQNGAFSISVFVKLDAEQTGDNTIIGWGAASDYTRLFIQNGSFNLGMQTKSGYPYAWNDNSAFDSEKWHNIIATYDGTAKKVIYYIDGVEYKGCPSKDVPFERFNVEIEPMTDWFTIGAMNDKNVNFKGLMDDLRIYDRVLSQDDVNAIMNLANPSEPDTPDTPDDPTPDTADRIMVVSSVLVSALAAAVVFKKRK